MSTPAVESTKAEVPTTEAQIAETKKVVAKPLASDGTAQQFKIVRVRKPDGTIVKVKRPITAEEAAKLSASKAEPASSGAAPRTQETKIAESKPTAAVTKTTVPTTSSDAVVKDEKTVKPSSPSTLTTKPVQAAKPTQTTTPTSSAKPAETPTSTASQTPTSKTDKALDTVAKGARAYRGLRILHRGSSRVISVLAPQWDIEDWQDGDEDWSDDDDDMDDDEERYDSDDDDDNDRDRDNDRDDRMTDKEANAAATGIANSAATDIATMKNHRETTRGADAPAKNVKASEKSEITKPEKAKAADTPSKAVKSPVINEKEVTGSDLEKEAAPKDAPPTPEGRNLKKRYTDWSRYIIWVIMIMFPLLFMIIGILVAVRNGTVTGDSLGSGTNQALTVAISVWPIIFAAILAQSLRAYATYKVERGVRLMTLEQLVNSNSVASSIKQPFLLRRFNWITVALLILWGLSPLATQAMQRISSDATENTLTADRLRYINTAANDTNFLAASSEAFDTVRAEFNRLYSAAFLPTYSTLGSDPYNNALIPMLYDIHNTSWQDTDPSSSNFGGASYASRYGVPVAQIYDASVYDYYSSTSTYNITIEAGYLDFYCAPMKIITSEDFLNLTLTLGDSQENTLYMEVTPMAGHSNGTLALASLITADTADPENPIPIDFTQQNINYTYTYTLCNFSQILVDVNISCTSGQCYAYGVRPTNITNSTTHPGFTSSGTENWVRGVLGSSGASNTSVPTATDTERYLMSYGNLADSKSRVNLTTLDMESFNQNLGFLMNTAWSIGFAPQNLTNLFYNASSSLLNAGLATTSTSAPLSYAPGFKIDSRTIYKTNWGWLAALFICSVFLLLAGIFSIWWDARTVSPDVLGFASSVVRKSKYVQLPKVDSAASGAERARALGEVRVMMQDVKPKAEVGRIALGTAHPNAQRLVTGRAYR